MKNYEIRVIPKVDIAGKTYWTAFFPTIDACVGGGNSVEEAIKEAEENLEIYLEYLKKEKFSIPEEYKESACNGKIALRVARSTHAKLIQLAESENVSLNMLINNAIECFIGRKEYDIEFMQKLEKVKELSQESNDLQKFNLMVNQKMYNKLWEKGIEVLYNGGGFYG